MFKIKRTKQGPPTVQVREDRRVEVPGAIAVHYATGVSQRGDITGWSRNESDAVAVTEAVAKRVHDYYAGKKNVGEFEAVPVDLSAAALSHAVVDDSAVGADEFKKLQAECKRLLAENMDLGSAAGVNAEKLKAAQSQADAAKIRAADLEAELLAKGDQIARLNARVAELEAVINDPTPSVPSGPNAPGTPAPGDKGGKKKQAG